MPVKIMKMNDVRLNLIKGDKQLLGRFSGIEAVFTEHTRAKRLRLHPKARHITAPKRIATLPRGIKNIIFDALRGKQLADGNADSSGTATAAYGIDLNNFHNGNSFHGSGEHRSRDLSCYKRILMYIFFAKERSPA